MRIISVSDVCRATADAAAQNLPAVLAGGFTAEKAARYPRMPKWGQVPTLEALLTQANFPTGGVTSPGLAVPPKRNGRNYDAPWRISVGIYDRGSDWSDTADRVRDWAALLRAAVLSDTTLGGLASAMTWAGEEYRQIPDASNGRTIGGCAVAFDITVRNVVDLAAPAPDGPIATTARTRVTVRPPQAQE